MKPISSTEVSALLTSSTVLLYPTDTIYGLGGLVTPHVINKINNIKQRPSEKAYSLVAPSFCRVEDYFMVEAHFAEQWNSYKTTYPGRGVTVILPLNPDRPDDIDFSLVSQTNQVGIRFLDHPIQACVEQLGKPLITTSANLSGQPNITHPSQLTKEQEHHIDYVIDEGILDNPPSVIIEYTTGVCLRS